MASVGRMIEGRTYAPGSYAFGRVKKGQVLRVIDVEGEQVADFMSMKLDDQGEYLDCIYTNLALGRWRWAKGDIIYTNEFHPLWTMVDDTVGVHYTGGGYCSRALRRTYKIDDKDGCRETIQAALSANKYDPRLLQAVSVIHIFMNVFYRPDGTWGIDRPKSKAGDHVDLRAEMDLFWACSVCSEPPVLNPVNGDRPTPIRFETYEAA
jgi:uncharacterized protein YcgI (DUF1989 family)